MTQTNLRRGASRGIALAAGGLGIVLSLGGETAGATDAALIEVLRNNKLITEKQYRTLIQTQAPAAPANTLPIPQSDQDLLDVLLANGLISQAQFAALRVKTGLEKKTDPEAKAVLKDGFKIKTQDNTFQAQVGAYLQFDSAIYGDDETDFSSATELRRGRLSLAGTLFTDWDYKFEADFAGSTQGGSTNTVTVTVTDAFVRYTGFRPIALTAGNFKVPFGLEAVGSGKYTTFTERGLPFAFLTLRRLGGMVSTNGTHWTASIGAFGDTVTTQNGDDEGQEVAGRFTFSPLFEMDRVVHLGLSGGWVSPQQNAAGTRLETVQFRAKPETNIMADSLTASTAITAANKTFGRSSGRLVDTGNLPGDVNYFVKAGGELAAIYGPFSIQGEYILTELDRDQGGTLGFDGYYAYGSWFLTGESRNYRADKGVFDALLPLRPFNPWLGGWGAWELAARYSSLDLNDRDVRGGAIDDLTVGINWYPNAYVRLMANYVNVLKVQGGAHDGDNPDLFQLRLQFAY